MHEISLVRSLISQALTAVESLPSSCIRTVRVLAGPLCGVEPILVALAFDALKSESGLDQCRLTIDQQELMAVCRECSTPFEVHNFVFRCPVCLSGSVRITQGEDFRLISLEVEGSI